MTEDTPEKLPLPAPPPGTPVLHGRDRAWQRLLRLVSVRNEELSTDDSDDWNAWRDVATGRFFERMPDWLEFKGKSVLDVGCGFGSTCIEVADRGAAEVLGVDLDPGYLEEAKANLAERPDLADRLRFELMDVRDIDRTYDVLISQDSMEHYPDPETFVPEMLEPLAPGGLFVVGFGPLWKAPLGGHSVVTHMPWAHLIFPENVMLIERRRFRPGETPTRYEDVRGGLNRMTLEKFMRIMGSTGLEPVYLKTNRGDHPVTRVFRVLDKIKPIREYVTTNIYSVWRRSI